MFSAPAQQPQLSAEILRTLLQTLRAPLERGPI
jgi:hypothetical protein